MNGTPEGRRALPFGGLRGGEAAVIRGTPGFGGEERKATSLALDTRPLLL